ncbi:Zinc finger, C2H2 domain and Zinc finger, C2H2-like domain-containing protein [Strongyloides ratti]|uniref:Zinc finger, C2H2 domain and Zinc finger, C2H2-like domain-containing protein n=1 Tax=Strongyloides ratti TaxID=34506 RepID=A0A090LNI3_STRRB|nr:Zinc finger, C2H2 domain and Zinc finger, C2H2-like domain-containing protein [Strongyloides ratti]CEF69704.1 Zinc finger, C2H2 domain and Zinc finger, C2H2-like domain-containing protein [Strongyloides ratti]
MSALTLESLVQQVGSSTTSQAEVLRNILAAAAFESSTSTDNSPSKKDTATTSSVSSTGSSSSDFINSSSLGGAKMETDVTGNDCNKNVNYAEIWNRAVNSSGGNKEDFKNLSLEQSFLTTGVNGLPIMNLKCTECGVVKTTSEDLEIHIKVEHLNWLPFECPLCKISRPSDNQMREHIHSSHRQNTTKFQYLDNETAKRTLQLMMDKAHLAAASSSSSSSSSSLLKSNINKVSVNDCENLSQKSSNKRTLVDNLLFSKLAPALNGCTASLSPTSSPNSPAASSTTTTTSNTNLLQLPISRKRPATSTTTSSSSSSTTTNNDIYTTESFLAQLQKNTSKNNDINLKNDDDKEHRENEIQTSNNEIDFSIQLANLFGSLKKDNLLCKMEKETSPIDSTSNTLNLTALLNSSVANLDAEENKRSKIMAKKRVLGLCSRCQKPVTAGSRQVHIFYHLGKDYSMYRFQCLYPNCTVAHYRKDQLEAHHIKAHGGINPSMLEDRSQELNAACQELSMELLGTTNNNPGPTAAEAQVIFEALQKEAVEQMSKKKKRKKSDGKTLLPKMMLNSMGREDGPHSEMIECRICDKFILAKIKGFHVLWHITKDKGIPRYACKVCNYKHDRSLNVNNHAKAAHGMEDCCEDMMVKHAHLVKEMSEECFGSMVLSFNGGFTNNAEARKKSHKNHEITDRENKAVNGTTNHSNNNDNESDNGHDDDSENGTDSDNNNENEDDE